MVKCLNFGSDSETIAQSILCDSALTGFYEQLTCTCYALVEVLGFPGSSAVAAGPGHVHKVYIGDVPWSIYIDWLETEADLKSLILKAYRCEELTASKEFIVFVFLCSVNRPWRDESFNAIDKRSRIFLFHLYGSNLLASFAGFLS